MRSGEDWVMRPVLAGCCKYESLLNGAIQLEDIARMNDALDVNAYNDFKIEEYRRRTDK